MNILATKDILSNLEQIIKLCFVIFFLAINRIIIKYTNKLQVINKMPLLHKIMLNISRKLMIYIILNLTLVNKL